MNMKICGFIILCLFSNIGMSDDVIKSTRGIYLIKDEIHVSPGHPDDLSKNENRLNTLWNSIKKIVFVDTYSQGWKSTTPIEISFYQGSGAKNFVVQYGDNFAYAETQRAMLFKWGCDDSIVPTLNLGKWPLEDKPSDWERGGIAIEISRKYGLPKSVSKNSEIFYSIPEVRAMQKKHGKIRFYSQIQWESLPNIKVFKYGYGFESEGEDGLIIYDKTTKKVVIHREKSIFVEHC